MGGQALCAVRLFEFFDDVRGDAAAVGEFVAVGLGPVADGFGLFLRAGLGHNGAGGVRGLLGAAAGAARAGDEIGEGVPEFGGVVRLEVDVVGDAVQAEAHGFYVLGGGAIEVIDELDEHLLRHDLVRFLAGLGEREQ